MNAKKRDELLDGLLIRALVAEAGLEHEQNMAMAFVFDANRSQAVTCYWCSKCLGVEHEAIREHTANCPKRPPPADVEARISTAVAEEREHCARLVEEFNHVDEAPRIAADIRARGAR